MPLIVAEILRENLNLLERSGEASDVPWFKWVALAGGAVVVIAGGIFISRRRKRLAVATAGALTEPAAAVALRNLARWDDLQDEAQFRAAVAAISTTIRLYIEGRFGLHAPRLTTEEFWAALRTTKSVPQKFEHFLESFMRECDAIKYAGQTLTLVQLKALLAAANNFVRSTPMP
jgi:hypothetical protein